MEDVARLVDSVMASAVQGQIFCPELMLFRWNRTLCAANEKAGDVDGDLEGEKERCRKLLRGGTRHFCESSAVGSAILIPVKNVFFRGSVFEMEIHFWKKNRRGTRGCRCLTIMLLETMHISTPRRPA